MLVEPVGLPSLAKLIIHVGRTGGFTLLDEAIIFMLVEPVGLPSLTKLYIHVGRTGGFT